MLEGKKFVLGITGSIAAYKAAYLIRALIKKGAEVQVVITPAGKEFITPITLSALTSKPVISEFFSQRDGTWHSHVDLGLWADAMIVAPATASTIGKMAHGIADNMLITTYLSMKAPVFIAPAMDLDMFAHPATQHNLDILRSYGNHIIEPGEGELASHLVGKGRMEEPDNIVRILEDYFAKGAELAKKKVVITAGPTYEKIDPVRFIGNYSSGKMGYALAEECAVRGAEVILVSGPVQLTTSHPGIRRIDVESAAEMHEATLREFADADAAILCAAVADFTPEEVADHKIKREHDDLVLRLKPTHDIAAALCAAVADFTPEEVADHKIKREHDDLVLRLKPTHDIAAALGQRKQAHQCLVGFALETDHEAEHAQDKLRRKNLNFIVLNSLRDAGAGFRHDTNKITILDAEGSTAYPLKSKKEVAADIVDRLCREFVS